jgi:hypothetical protein
MVEKKKKNKKKGFHEMIIEFAQSHQMATKMDLVTTRFDCHYLMANNVDLIATIKFGCCH